MDLLAHQHQRDRNATTSLETDAGFPAPHPQRTTESHFSVTIAFSDTVGPACIIRIWPAMQTMRMPSSRLTVIQSFRFSRNLARASLRLVICASEEKDCQRQGDLDAEQHLIEPHVVRAGLPLRSPTVGRVDEQDEVVQASHDQE